MKKFGSLDLMDLVDCYVAARDIREGQEGNIRRSVVSFCNYVGRSDPPLECDVINRWLRSFKLSPQSINNYRRDLLAVLNYAADRQLCDRVDPRLILRRNVTLGLPRAFTLEEIGRLVAAARTLIGHDYSHSTRADYWSALIIGAYDLGFRRGDLFRVPATIKDGQPFVFTESKTGITYSRQLSTLGCTLAKRIDHFDLAYPWERNKTTFVNTWKTIATRAQVGGRFKNLRCAFVTHSGWRHRDIKTSLRHYVDPRINQKPDSPPPISI